MADNEETTEITLDSVIETPIEELSDEQTAFLRDNADSLDDDQRETYKDILEKKEEAEDEGEIDPDKVEIPTRKGVAKDESSDDDEDIDPEDAKKIDKIVSKRLKEEGATGIKDQFEVDSFIRSKPEYGKYRAVALKYMGHPDYKNIPVHNIMAIVSANDMQKIGAQKEREAQRKVNDTKGTGTTSRAGGKKTFDWHNASKEDFEAQKAKVLGRQGA